MRELLFTGKGKRRLKNKEGMRKLTGKHSHDMICMNWRPGLSPAVQ